MIKTLNMGLYMNKLIQQLIKTDDVKLISTDTKVADLEFISLDQTGKSGKYYLLLVCLLRHTTRPCTISEFIYICDIVNSKETIAKLRNTA